MKRRMLLVVMVAVATAVAALIVTLRGADIIVGDTADEDSIEYVGVGS